MKNRTLLSMATLVLAMIMLVAAMWKTNGCASLPPWAVQHGLLIAGAIAEAYAPQREQIADSIVTSVELVQKLLDDLAMQPTPEDYRLTLAVTLEEAGLSKEAIDDILDRIFPPPPDVLGAYVKAHDNQAIASYLLEIEKGLREAD